MSAVTNFILRAGVVGLFVGAIGTAASENAKGPVVDPAAGVEFFERKIRPVLVEQCYDCHSHGSKKLKAELYLDSREGMLQGGESGVAIVLGEPEKSRLIEAIRYADLQMPPKRKLPDSVVADFVAWVRIGAPWPEEKGKTLEVVAQNGNEEKRKREHWAWQAVRDHVPPGMKDTRWAHNAVDRFVLAKLEEKRMRPAGEADRRMLIRRAYFDLIGLPPSVEEVESFVADESADAFEKVVDRLLASSHYGERQARHWLDVARYGEDQAHNFQPRLYPNGFRYRDWVVNAFNSDLPYDEFVRQQIAADLIDGPDKLGRMAALGFFATGPVYYGDGKMFDQLSDRVDTLSRGFLGLTVACARCHDHKYDPISQKEYYSLAGVFWSSAYTEVPLAEKELVEKYDTAQKAIEAKSKEIDGVIASQTADLRGRLTDEITRYMVGAWEFQRKRKADASLKMGEFAEADRLHELVLDRWVKYLRRRGEEDRAHLARWHQVVKEVEDKGDSEEVKKEVWRAAEAFEAYVKSLVRLREAAEKAHEAAVANASDAAKGKVQKPALEKGQAAVLDEVVGNEGLLTVPKNQVEKLLGKEERGKIAALRSELERMKKDAPAKYPVVHALKEGAKVGNLPVLLRGNADTPGEEAPRQFLAVLSGGAPKPFQQGSGRLELANAIADRSNPLTARVMVNRIWQQHFGRGLVATSSNFGLLGQPPSHPELLDYLARRFVESGWSVKAMHRMIMLSATYRQGSNAEDDAVGAGNSENVLLSRQNRRRLDVESWRDALLFVSGQLDTTVGGPSIPLSKAENRRRTMYAAVSRHDLDPLLRLFDFPDPNVTSDARTVTTVPLQQLFVLNGEFMVSQARALATRIEAVGGDDEAKIRRAYLMAYGRVVGEEELEIGLEFLKSGMETSEKDRLSRWEQYAHALLSANEFMYVD